MGRFKRYLVVFGLAVLLFAAVFSDVVEGQAVTRFVYEFSDFRPLAVYATDRYIVLAGSGGGPAVVVVNRTSGLIVSSWYISGNDPNSCDIAFDGSYLYIGCVRYGDYIFLGKYSYPGLGVVYEKRLSGFAYSVIDVYAASGNMYFVLNAVGGGASVLAGYISSDGATVMLREVAPSGVTDVVMLSGIVGYSDDLVGLCGFLRYTSGGTTYNNLFYLEIYIGSGTVTKNVVVSVPSVPGDGYSFVEAWLEPSTNKVIFSVGRYVVVFDTGDVRFERINYIGISGASYYYDSDIEISGNLYLFIRYYNTSLPGYMLGFAKLDVSGSIYASYGYRGTYSFFNDFAVYGDNIAVAGSSYSPYFVFYAPIGVGIPGKVTASPITVSFTSVSYSGASVSFALGQPGATVASVTSASRSYVATGYIFVDIVTTTTTTQTFVTTTTETATSTVTTTETATSIETVINTVTTTVVHAVPYPYTFTTTVTTTVYQAPSLDIYVVVFVVAALIAVAIVYRRK